MGGPRTCPCSSSPHTIKGKGVDFMENNVVYHYASADSELCARAKARS